ncbi:MAG TPA: FecR domain-containing protein, partial [Calditrichia bacterium]|nr:FecR domain-containing protein [Calditrichia bacterium]
PDGSSVVVNSGSRLSYPERFTGEERRVFLEGEAYFSVRKDPAHPFVVVSENASTVVLGTRFSVYDRQGSLRVVVDEGSVRVTPQGLEAVPDILKAGQLLRFRHGAASAEIEAVAPNSLTAWQNGDIAFHQTPLDEIAAELSRRYNTPIEIGNLDPQRYSLTGTFPDQELPQILSSICLALNLNYHIREGGSVSIFKP